MKVYIKVRESSVSRNSATNILNWVMIEKFKPKFLKKKL